MSSDAELIERMTEAVRSIRESVREMHATLDRLEGRPPPNPPKRHPGDKRRELRVVEGRKAA